MIFRYRLHFSDIGYDFKLYSKRGIGLVGVGCGCAFDPFRSQYSDPQLSTQIPVSQTFFKSLSCTLHFPIPHSTYSVFFSQVFYPTTISYYARGELGWVELGLYVRLFTTQIPFPKLFSNHFQLPLTSRFRILPIMHLFRSVPIRSDPIRFDPFRSVSIRSDPFPIWF